MAAPFWNRIELNAVRELHGFAREEFPILALAPPATTGIAVGAWDWEEFDAQAGLDRGSGRGGMEEREYFSTMANSATRGLTAFGECM